MSIQTKKKLRNMKTYTLKLKGTKKNKTSDLTVEILGDNKNQALAWAYYFFEKGEFTEPYFASGANRMCGGTADFIPGVEKLMDLKGKYFVPRTSIKCK